MTTYTVPVVEQEKLTTLHTSLCKELETLMRQETPQVIADAQRSSYQLFVELLATEHANTPIADAHFYIRAVRVRSHMATDLSVFRTIDGVYAYECDDADRTENIAKVTPCRVFIMIRESPRAWRVQTTYLLTK